jgi:predicted dehydrogenase
MTVIKRVGIVGTGRIARLHAHAIRAAGAEIAGVVSSSPERAAAGAEQLGVERSFPDIDHMLADESIDAVHITSPNTSHAGHLAAVIAAGRHFVCEKPFVTSAIEAQSLQDAATKAGVIGTVAFTYRFHPIAREARARVAAGELGPLVTVRGGYVQDWLLAAPPSEWRLDTVRSGPSRAFADIGSHTIDLLQFISGERVARLAAVERGVLGGRAQGADVSDDAIAVVVQLEGGAIGALLVSQVTAGRGQSLTLELSGERAGIAIDQEDPVALWSGMAGTGTGSRLDLTAGGLSPEATALGFTPTGTMGDYLSAFDAFVRDSYSAMSGSVVDGLPTVADGVRAALIGDAVRRSATEESWVAVM